MNLHLQNKLNIRRGRIETSSLLLIVGDRHFVRDSCPGHQPDVAISIISSQKKVGMFNLENRGSCVGRYAFCDQYSQDCDRLSILF
jgi:hypothetical protein